MWIRILGILYNLSLVQAIEYCAKDKILYLHYGACGVHNRRDEYSSPVMNTTEISFALPQYGNDYGLSVYSFLIRKLEVMETKPIKKVGIAIKPITEADLNQVKGKPRKGDGVDPDAEFIEG